METQPLNNCKQVCIDEVNISFHDHCPTNGTCSWICAAERFEKRNGTCGDMYMYMCAMNVEHNNGNLTPVGYYIEACVYKKQCEDGIFLFLTCIYNNIVSMAFLRTHIFIGYCNA